MKDPSSSKNSNFLIKKPYSKFKGNEHNAVFEFLKTVLDADSKLKLCKKNGAIISDTIFFIRMARYEIKLQ